MFNFKINFFGNEFEGLKFNLSKETQIMDENIKQMLAEKNILSKDSVKLLMKNVFLETVHVNLTKMYVTRFISCIMLISLLITFQTQAYTSGIIQSIVFFGMILIANMYKNEACGIMAGMNLSIELVDIVYDENKEIKIAD